MKEDFFIKNISNRHIGDDGAVIDGYVYATDSFFEDVHFKRNWLSLSEIIEKSVLVNLSDIIVMNAKPKYALVNIGFPNTYTLKEIKEITETFNKCAHKYGFEIIGGDTVKNEKLTISITFIGITSKPVFRKAKLGEYVAYTGNLGGVSKDLKTLLRGGKISKKSKFIKPVLKKEFFYRAADYVTSALDISDGLFKELERISETSKVGFRFFKKLDKNVGCSGEEYEILFTFPKKNLSKILNLAKLTRTEINIIGMTTRGKFRSICKENHF